MKHQDNSAHTAEVINSLFICQLKVMLLLNQKRMSFITMETANLIQIAECCYNTQPNNSEVHKNTYSSSRLKTLSPWWPVRCSENPLWIPVCTWWTQQNFPPAAEKGKQTDEMRLMIIVHTVSSLQTQPQSQNNSELCFRLQTCPDADYDSKPNLLHGSLSLSLFVSLFVLTHGAHLCNVELCCGQFQKLLSLIHITDVCHLKNCLVKKNLHIL